MARHYLDGLLELGSYDRAAQRSVLRQSLASLALAAGSEGPPPLDGLAPEALLGSVKVALAGGLFDDVSFLAPEAAAVALYELAGALPAGAEKRELGRRVLAQLYEGNAATFVAVATRMARGNARALGGAGIRARVGLCLGLSFGSEVRVGPLALALLMRRELAREWVVQPAQGSLPERRLAARLLERAAREAVRRAWQGDDQAKRMLARIAGGAEGTGRQDATPADALARAWHDLLADRETLVSRHVAAARGILSGVVPELADRIEQHLASDLSPTEWRRAATSLAAAVATDPERALPKALDVVRGPLLDQDPGIAAAFLWGMAPAADAEPEAAEELLDALALRAPIPIAEALVELRLEVPHVGAKAARRAAAALAQSLSGSEPDDGLAAIAHAALRDLTSETDARELSDAVRAAIAAFVEAGSREARARAQRALEKAYETLEALEALEVGDAASSVARRTSVDLLRDLDIALLESGALRRLLALDRGPGDDARGVAKVDDLEDRLAAWLLREEASGPTSGKVVHVTLHLRQLRALLHLLDGEASEGSEDGRGRRRCLAACRTLLGRLVAERGSPLRRATTATLARGFDALVREGAADPADVLLHAAMHLPDPKDLRVLAEASMHPDVSDLLVRFAACSADDAERALEGLGAFVGEIAADASERTRALRHTLSRIARALEAVGTAPDLSTLVPRAGSEGEGPLESLVEGRAALAQLVSAAARRFGEVDAADQKKGDVGALGTAARRVVHAHESGSSAVADARQDLEQAIASFARACELSIPRAVASVVASALGRVPSLPVEPPRSKTKAAPSDHPLPDWLPSRRMIGGFYVHRTLGGGSAGTVFVVSRAEDRHDPDAERFALKVPDYDASTARSLSEAEFLRMFREEAGALLAIPDHPNLARLVTFDAGARPKPILVMELCEGVRCDALIESGTLTTDRALALLDGVLAGLEAMHGVGVGHLDVKPSNVVLRGDVPVLVDFGLAGRHLRPGCATGCYGAPEIWGILAEHATPMTADVYAFACLAYEVLTGRTLFDAPTEVALVSAHITHDGRPPPIARLAEDARLAPLADLLARCLRHDPRQRASVCEVRRELARLTRPLAELPWPLWPAG